MTDEPVGYLGGASGDDPYGDTADDPHNPHNTATDDGPEEMEYALPPAENPPEAEVVGYLGGESELPGLPPVEEDSAAYSHRDFMAGGEGGEEYYEDPYGGDPYSQYEDPYGGTATAEDDPYAGYDATAAADTDPSYFDSLGHDDDQPETGMQTQTEVGYDTEEFADDDQPKTISQQDAESIIRRITTKRILPPEQQQAKPLNRPQPLTPAGGGLKIWPILLVLVILSGAGIYVFRKQLSQLHPALAFLYPQPDVGPIMTDVKKVDPNEVKKKKLLEMVLMSEAKALGVDMKALREKKDPAPGDKPADADKAPAKTQEGGQ